MPSQNSSYINNVHLLIYKHICPAVDELYDILDMSVMIRVCMCNLSWCCYLLRLRVCVCLKWWYINMHICVGATHVRSQLPEDQCELAM